MSEPANGLSGPQPLQFDVAETGGSDASSSAAPEATTSKACSRFSRGMRATGLGLAAAIAGSLLYFAVAAITGREFGLVAIAVGYMVGKAVRRGSRGRGGWAYQTLAIGLTYLAIVSTYVPLIIAKEFQKDAAKKDSSLAQARTPMADTITISARGPDVGRTIDSVAAAQRRDTGFAVMQAGAPKATARPMPVRTKRLGPGTVLLGVGELVVLAAKIPILAGFSNIVGLVIIGIAVFVAWELNRRVSLVITGLDRVASGAKGAAAID